MAKRPDDSALREMAAQTGMTFKRMAHELAVDPKTARRWCRDAGINECGTKKRVDETILASGDTKVLEIVTETPEAVTNEPLPPLPLVSQEQESITDIIVKIDHFKYFQIKAGVPKKKGDNYRLYSPGRKRFSEKVVVNKTIDRVAHQACAVQRKCQ